jgi:hypothetical protein
VGGTGDEAELGQLVLTLSLGLVIARGGRRPVIVKVTERGKEGMLLGLDLLKVLLLEGVLIESSLWLVLAGGVLALVLALARVILVGGVLVLLRIVGDEVVRVSTSVASILRTTTTPVIQAVVVKPREPADDQYQLVVPKGLQLLLCDRHQRRQDQRYL